MVFILNTTLHKIPFQRKLLVKLTDPRGLIDRIRDLTASRKAESTSRKNRKHNPLISQAENLFPKIQVDTGSYNNAKQPWLTGPSSKLVVLIHGLNSSPLAWSGYLKEKHTAESTASYFVPYVHQKGYCKISEAADPILKTAQAYANRHPNNPIFLVGHSNGARIAAYIEQGLQAKHIHLVSIAGPHCGSNLMKWIDRLGMAKILGIPPIMTQELMHMGEWPIKQLIKWQDSQETYKKTEKMVKRVFFASADDWRVFPNETSFPNLPNSSYYLIGQESHVTIIDGVKDEVLSYISK